MKAHARLTLFALLAGLLTTRGAQPPEQWLQYHVAPEGMAYRWLALTNVPPPGLALPKLNAKPYFACWTTPLDPKGRWLCLDRTRKTGPYDRVFVDSTGKGQLDEKPGATAKPNDQFNAFFDPLRIVLKGEDGPIVYHIVLRFLNYSDGDVRLLVSSGGYYAGTVDFGGKKRRIQLVDSNVNGTFNDLGSSPDDCDEISLDGDTLARRSLGRLLEVDGRFFRIETARDGAFVKIQRAEDVVLGQVQVPETISEFSAVGENGHFVRKPAKGELSLPVGKYRAHEWTIVRKDDRGASWQLLGSGFGKPGEFEVAADRPCKLRIGEPVRAVVRHTESGKQVDFNLRFQGLLNESVQVTKAGLNPTGPRLTLTSLDGSFRWGTNFEFG